MAPGEHVADGDKRERGAGLRATEGVSHRGWINIGYRCE